MKKKLFWMLGGAGAIVVALVGLATGNPGLACLPLPLLLIAYWLTK